MTKKMETIVTRHSERADGDFGKGGVAEGVEVSEKWPTLSKEGEEKAREIARGEFKQMIDESTDGTVTFIGGTSEQQRAKDTADIVGDELAQIYKDDEGVLAYTKEDIEKLREEARAEARGRKPGEKGEGGKVLKKIKEIIDANPDKKIIFTYPIFAGFSITPDFRDENGEFTPYMAELLERTDKNAYDAYMEWFRNKGKLQKGDETLEMASPEQVVENNLKDLTRLRDFARRANLIEEDRPLNIGVVGHGGNLDALAVYLANKGEVTPKNYERMFRGEAMQMPEVTRITMGEKESSLRYRGEEYPIDLFEK